MKPIIFNLDIQEDSYESCDLMQGYDYNIQFNITDGYTTLDLTGVSIQIQMQKADHKFIIQTEKITVVNNIINVAIDKDLTRVNGKGKLQVVLSKDNRTFGSWVVKCNIKANAINNNDGQTENKVTITEALTNKVTEANNAKVELDKSIANGDIEKMRIDIDKNSASLEDIKNFQYVSYFDFGANGNGITDDTESIYNTHIWANENNIPVRNQNGIFKLDTTKIIPVKTNCYLYGTKFIINEAKNIYFEIKSLKSKIVLDNATYSNKFIKNTNSIASLSSYSNSYLYFEDINTRVGKRYGTTQTFSLQDFVVIGDGGKIVGDIIHDILSPTLIEVYPFDDNNLEFNGATFDLICEGSPIIDYGIGGLLITRSNVTVNDVIMTPLHNSLHSSGSIYFGKCANITVTNSTFRPRVPKLSTSGSYGIGGEKVINLNFINCNGESTSIAGGTTNYWGVMGTNLIKNMTIYNCNFNRVDCHFQAYDIKINNSIIGNRGITVCGGGNLELTNSSITSLDIITLRSDYGARWDGDIIIDNIYWTPFSDNNISIINSTPNGDGTYDFGYELTIGKNISISNIKMYQLFQGTEVIPIIRTFDNDTFNGNYYFPYNLNIRNLSFINRYNLRGYVFSNNTQIYKLLSKSTHSYTSPITMTTNCNITLDNVTLYDFKQSNPLSSGLQNVGHFIIDKCVNDNIYTSNSQICPKITLRNLEGLTIKPRGLRCIINIDNCNILFIDCYGVNLHTTSNICNYTKINNSEIRPTLSEGAYSTITNRYSLFITGEINNTKLYPIFTTIYKNDLNCYKYLIDTTNRRIGKLDVFNISTSNVSLKQFDLVTLALNDTDIENVFKNNNNTRYSKLYGTTANRQHNDLVPYWYFDTTISKPVCWNGASWYIPT
ncbi:MAG: hypothetical protein ACRC5M_07010 [Anaeroplasmataceae bacterium]